MKKTLITFSFCLAIAIKGFSQNIPIQTKTTREENKNIHKRQKEEKHALLKQDKQNLKELRQAKRQSKYEGDKTTFRNEKNTLKNKRKSHRRHAHNSGNTY
jgi:hypothetical protein